MRTKSISVLLCLILFVAGCGTFAPADPEPEVGQPHITNVEEIQLSPPTISLDVNQRAQFTATVLPANATNKEVTWSSDNPSVATVNPTGLVTAQGNGSTVITITSADGNITAIAAIIVRTPVTGVSLDKSALELAVEETAQLTATVKPATASEKGVTWSSSDPAVATVSPNGLVTARASGSAVITVTTDDGDKTATATVTVPDTATADELRMLALVNRERQKEGVPPLSFFMDLALVARLKSQDMIDKDYFDHNSPTYGPPYDMMQNFGIEFTAAGENLALDNDVEGAHRALMDSEGHRANILNPIFTDIGIGIIRDSRGYYYITQMFIRR